MDGCAIKSMQIISNVLELFLACQVIHKGVRTECMSVPVSAPVPQPHITTKLPIKLYISNTTVLLHGEKQSWQKLKQDVTN